MNQPHLTTEDTERLNGQCKRIMAHADGVWRSLAEWSQITQGSEAGTSARLRELSNKYGYKKERKHVEGGLFVYRIEPPVTYRWEGQQSIFL